MSPLPDSIVGGPFREQEENEEPQPDEEPSVMETLNPSTPFLAPPRGSLNPGSPLHRPKLSTDSSMSLLSPRNSLQQYYLGATPEEQKALRKLRKLAAQRERDANQLSVYESQLSVYESQQTVPSNTFPQVLAAISVSLGSLIVGLTSAYTSSALVSLESPNSTIHIESNGTEASWIGSLMPLGALCGSFAGGAIIELLGRKMTLLATTLPFIVSWLLIALAQHVDMIYAGRTIQGICVGIASLCLPVYLGETVQPEVRGTLGLMPTTVGNLGLLICFTTGKFLDWQYLAFLCALLSCPFLIFMFFIPETPRWYIAHGKDEKAEKALQWLRGKDSDIRQELTDIKKTHIASSAQKSKFTDLFNRAYAKPMIVSFGLMFFQQFSGISAVIFYTVFIFNMSGSSLDANICTIIVGVVNFCATFIANILIDRLGRKVLLILSEVGMIFSLGALAGFFSLKEYLPEYTTTLGWVPLASFMIFVIAFSLGYGPIPWLMLGEIFPGKIRGTAAAASTAFNWICAFCVTKAFPEFISIFGPHITFAIFGIICFLGLFFIIFVVPETQGLSLEDLEAKLTRPFRRLSSTANLKPSPMFM